MSTVYRRVQLINVVGVIYIFHHMTCACSLTLISQADIVTTVMSSYTEGSAEVLAIDIV